MSKIQKADPTARRNAIAIALAMLVLGACAVALVERYQLQISEWLAANAANIADSPGLAVAGALAVFAPLLAFSIYMFLFGRRVAGAQRFPPPGYRVVRDTKIVEGVVAVKRGRLLQSLSLALFVSIGIAILLAVRLINAITTGP